MVRQLPLGKLAKESMHTVIRSMGVLDVINLMNVSEEMRELVRESRYRRIGFFRVMLLEQNVPVIRAEGRWGHVVIPFGGRRRPEGFAKFDKKSQYGLMYAHLCWLMETIPVTITWDMNMDVIDSEGIRQLCSFYHFRVCDAMFIARGSIKPDDLTFLLDSVIASRQFVIDSKIPLDYRHPNIFKKSEIYMISEAEWLTIEDLFTTEPYSITLAETNFTNEDVVKYLNFWMATPDNMTRYIEFPMMAEVELDLEAVMEEFTSIKIREAVPHGEVEEAWLITPRRSERPSRGPIIGKVGSEKWKSTGRVDFAFGAFYTQEFPGFRRLFDLIYRKEDLDEQIANLDKLIYSGHVKLVARRCPEDQKIVDLINKWNREIEEAQERRDRVVELLKENDVVYVDGKAELTAMLQKIAPF